MKPRVVAPNRNVFEEYCKSHGLNPLSLHRVRDRQDAAGISGTVYVITWHQESLPEYGGYNDPALGAIEELKLFPRLTTLVYITLNEKIPVAVEE